MFRFPRRLDVLPFLMLGLAASTVGPTGAESPAKTFRFAPPDGTFTRQVQTTRTRTMDDGTRQVDENSAKETIEITRTAGGYRMKVTPSEVEMSRNGVSIANPLITALTSVEVTYTLDADGRLVSIQGYDQVSTLLDRMASRLPAATQKALAQSFGADTLEARARAEYQGRVETFLGLTFEADDVLESESTFQMPTGEPLEYKSIIRFPSTEPCGRTTCVVIEQDYNSDPSQLPAAVTDLVDSVKDTSPRAKAVAEALGQGEMAIQGKVRRVIDPATMLIYHETLERVIDMTVGAPGQTPVGVTLSETRRHTYDYGG